MSVSPPGVACNLAQPAALLRRLGRQPAKASMEKIILFVLIMSAIMIVAEWPRPTPTPARIRD
jgi:hypothetical protein